MYSSKVQHGYSFAHGMFSTKFGECYIMLKTTNYALFWEGFYFINLYADDNECYYMLERILVKWDLLYPNIFMP